jgi:hypothetical protein
LVQHGDKTAEAIATSCLWFGITRNQIFDFLNMMFQNGVLDEEPEQRPSSAKTPPVQSLPQTLDVAVPVEV